MTDREKSVWEELLSKLEKKLKPQNFKTWFKPTQLYSVTSEKLTIMVPNDFFKKWLDRYYMGMIRREIAKISGHEMEVDFILPPKYNNIKKRKNVGFKKKRSVSRLNPRFHFNSFVVGNNNRLAHAAALAVAQSPARAYNPLFIYGKVGLGKTHLL